MFTLDSIRSIGFVKVCPSLQRGGHDITRRKPNYSSEIRKRDTLYST